MPSRMTSTASWLERSTSVSSMRRMKSPPVRAGKGPRIERGADVAEVDEAGRGRCEAGAGLVSHCCSHAMKAEAARRGRP